MATKKRATMKLHVTLTSPYARIVRAAILEQGLADRIEVVPARTRQQGSPYYVVAASGRVPYLERDDGPDLEETDVICAYLDELSDRPPLTRPFAHEGWAYGRSHALARSLIDGLAVLVRELRRPESERSPTIIAHEEARAARLLDLWEHEIDAPVMNGALTLAQMILWVAVDVARSMMDKSALGDRPQLAAWYARLGERPSLIVTRPPERN
jgi:glutathione S-transferase